MLKRWDRKRAKSDACGSIEALLAPSGRSALSQANLAYLSNTNSLLDQR